MFRSKVQTNKQKRKQRVRACTSVRGSCPPTMIGVRAVAARSTNRSDNDSGSGSGSSEDGGEEAALQELQERRDDVSARCRRARGTLRQPLASPR